MKTIKKNIRAKTTHLIMLTNNELQLYILNGIRPEYKEGIIPLFPKPRIEFLHDAAGKISASIYWEEIDETSN